MDLTNLNKDRKSRKSSLDLDPMMYGKIPPQARDLEVSVLGMIIQFKDAYDELSENLIAEAFYVESHQRIFKAAQRLVFKKQLIDILTIVQELKSTEELDKVGGPFYLTGLTKGITSYINIKAHSQIIVQQFIKRELIRIGGEIINDAYEDSVDCFELQGDAEKKILEVGQVHVSGGMSSINTVLKKTLEKIEEWRMNETTLTGIPTGFPELDRATRGWQAGDLIIIAARPSVGKTALALNIIRNAAINNIKPTCVAVWSLEMKAMYLVLRMLAAESGILLHRIQTGRLDESQMKELYKKGVEILSEANIHFDDSSKINLRLISAKARRLKKKNNLGLIVVDYLQLIKGDGKMIREQQIAEISRDLKELALELDIPIIALSQLSREGEKFVTWDKAPALGSLRESGAIEQDADVVMMLWGANEQEIRQNPELDGRRKVKIVKQRNGVVLTTQLDFKNEIQLFKEIDSSTDNRFKTVEQANKEQLINQNFKSVKMWNEPNDPNDAPF